MANVLNYQDASEYLEISYKSIQTNVVAGHKWEKAKVGRGLIDVDIVKQIEKERCSEYTSPLVDYGLMLFYYLNEVIGISKQKLTEEMNYPSCYAMLANQTNDFYTDLINKYSYLGEEFRKSEYNYMKVLERYEDTIIA